MTTIKQFNYQVRDSQGEIIPSDSKSISLRINDSTPKYLIHKSVVIQSRNNRQGTASCKTRSDVRGGGKKPWKQKGTGQARSGSSNSPLWRGGGVTFGPKPRSYEKKLNIKEKRLALRTALYYSMNKVTVIDNIFNSITVPKTKNIASAVRSADIRTLGLQVGAYTQVSINLINPMNAGPLDAYDAVAQHAPIHHAELVGLLPAAVLANIPRDRWEALDVSKEQTIEWRLRN
jgi:50S ribosomal protein L4